MTSAMESAWASSELTGLNSAYLESLYEQYLDNPNSVDAGSRAYFEALTRGQTSPDKKHGAIQEAFRHLSSQAILGSVEAPLNAKAVQVMNLIQSYRSWGHLKAKIDPLNLMKRAEVPELSLSYHGLSTQDLETVFELPGFHISGEKTLKNIISSLESAYCGSLALEYMHMHESQERKFFQERLEILKTPSFSPEFRKKILQGLISADGLEKFLGMKYAGQKRFSLEGGDALIPLVHQIIEEASQAGIEHVLMGMAHRGRLNVLVNILGKPPADLLAEFEGKHSSDLLSGDVKYHNGFSSEILTSKGSVHLALAFNPSHLEIVAPVVEGAVRAKQAKREFNRDKVMGLHMHGDAAFAGQGVVMETLNMSQTRAYYTGGSIHITINNQVGFTTSEVQDARSSVYCTGVAKMTECPIFHVNGDDIEAVIRVAQLALEYRMTFHKDVVIDLVCYRTHGHNEADEPAATQPLMYQEIRKHPTPWSIYAEKLLQAGLIQAGEAEAMFKAYQVNLEKGQSLVDLVQSGQKGPGVWARYFKTAWDDKTSTQIEMSKLLEIAQKLDQLPAAFTPQRQVAKVLQDRARMTRGELPINWGYAEVLAYGTLLKDDVLIRFTGEDVERGTFSHRHAVIHDQNKGETYTPLSQIAPRDQRFIIHNSVLSELAVLGFEYGYACANPEALVIWEAQFGDFVNMAQPVIDQFISSAEEKWGRLCGLMMLLPHGYEGMGAEHSSARLERFLQLCANDNIQVCVPTTPAQMFHLIRRQVLRPYRKPLVVMTPKSLLRHPACISSLEDLAKGEYQCVIPETHQQPIEKVRRVILCQGKVYYDLLAEREESKITDIAIIRLEQLYPFPRKALEFVLKPYAKVKDWVWCQEEPENQGAWLTIQHDIQPLLLKDQVLTYSGRAAFASPAAGYASLHREQQTALVKQALRKA